MVGMLLNVVLLNFESTKTYNKGNWRDFITIHSTLLTLGKPGRHHQWRHALFCPLNLGKSQEIKLSSTEWNLNTRYILEYQFCRSSYDSVCLYLVIQCNSFSHHPAVSSSPVCENSSTLSEQNSHNNATNIINNVTSYRWQRVIQ